MMTDLNGINGTQHGKVFTRVPRAKIKNLVNEKNSIGGELTKVFEKFNFRAPEKELEKLSQKERKEYEDLYKYTNSKSHGMDPEKDAKIKEWNKKHPNCLIRSMYDQYNGINAKS
ncbi:MAG: hypothetical protein NC191_05495 [Muribaculaceae bacterium]|nr:hypothetical protein [Muribaculaceae bacterium]